MGGLGEHAVCHSKVSFFISFLSFLLLIPSTRIQVAQRVRSEACHLLFRCTQDIARILRKVKETFSQFLVEASLPWHHVDSNVRKQTRGMSFTFISARINNKIQLQYHSHQ